jgi:CRP-like cAMP-binding protein
VSFSAALIHWIDPFIESLAQPDEQLALLCATVAAMLVVVSAFVKTMIPLRWLAVGSNIGFIAYGVMHGSPTLVLLQGVLLPVNLWRVAQMIRLTRRVNRAASDARQLGIWLRPYMRSRPMKAGEVIFNRGDVADRLYFLVEGRIELPDVGRSLDAGQMFGEIAFFAPDRRRSSSARCITPCTLLSIDETTFNALVLQNPDFGLEVMRLIAARLSHDVQRLQRAESQGPAAGDAPVRQAPVPARSQAAVDARPTGS